MIKLKEESNIVIVREKNLDRLAMTLSAYLDKGYSITGGVTCLTMVGEDWYTVIVVKPF